MSALGAFAATPDFTADVGLVPSDVALVDADGDGRLDITVTSQFAGDVRVIPCPRDIPPEDTLDIRFHPQLASVTWPLDRKDFR